LSREDVLRFVEERIEQLRRELQIYEELRNILMRGGLLSSRRRPTWTASHGGHTSRGRVSGYTRTRLPRRLSRG